MGKQCRGIGSVKFGFGRPEFRALHSNSSSFSNSGNGSGKSSENKYVDKDGKPPHKSTDWGNRFSWPCGWPALTNPDSQVGLLVAVFWLWLGLRVNVSKLRPRVHVLQPRIPEVRLSGMSWSLKWRNQKRQLLVFIPGLSSPEASGCLLIARAPYSFLWWKRS